MNVDLWLASLLSFEILEVVIEEAVVVDKVMLELVKSFIKEPLESCASNTKEEEGLVLNGRTKEVMLKEKEEPGSNVVDDPKDRVK